MSNCAKEIKFIITLIFIIMMWFCWALFEEIQIAQLSDLRQLSLDRGEDVVKTRPMPNGNGLDTSLEWKITQ